MRRPNGSGSVYKLKGNLRKPWVARKTKGWKDNGQPLYIFVGYYATRKEALDALEKFNGKPYDNRPTFAETHEKWLLEAEKDLARTTLAGYESTYKRHFDAFGRLKIAEIKLDDIQELLDGVTTSVGKMSKKLISSVMNYAVRHEIIPPDKPKILSYARLSNDEGRKVERKIFTAEEIERTTDPLILILLYTGLRVGEMLALKEEDIHLEERWLYVRKSKTPAGIRIVPIAERIVPCFSALPTDITYDRFTDVMFIESGHRPHDARHTFISMCADKGIDERVIRAIVGHSGSGITESVYTHIDLTILLEAVNKL